jgi:hypothetical protein
VIDTATEELHAAITTKGMLEAKIWRAIVTGSPEGEIASDIAAKAQLEKDISRRVIEQTASRMAANLRTVMELFDADGRLASIEKEQRANAVTATARDHEYIKRFDRIDANEAQTYKAMKGFDRRLDEISQRLVVVERDERGKVEREEILLKLDVVTERVDKKRAELDGIHEQLGSIWTWIRRQPSPEESAQLVAALRAIEARLGMADGGE